jgi:hypothetical protein
MSSGGKKNNFRQACCRRMLFNMTLSRSAADWFGRSVRMAALAGFALASYAGAPAQAAVDQAADAHSVPSVDGGIGSCSAEFTVNDGTGSPVYDAKVKVHIAYGFMRTHKLDLEVGTNVDGKARFTGLPEKVKEPLHFRAMQGDRQGDADYDPAENCGAKQTIVVSKDGK